MSSATYTLAVVSESGVAFCIEPGHPSKVKCYTSIKQARGAITQLSNAYDQDYHILETVTYSDGGLNVRWVE